VTDDEAGFRADLRDRDERFTSEQWDRYAALFHFVTRRRPTEFILTLEEAERVAPQAASALDSLVAEHGEPPAAFHRRDARSSRDLADVNRKGNLYDTLRARRTTRTFDDAPVTLAELSTLLKYTFGCHGCWRYTETLSALRRTSPSGGGLHPIEAYPILLNVDGTPAGTYHYNAERHALDLLREVSADEMGPRVIRAACGQGFAGSAGVIVVLSARFFRSFWKYRQDARAYSVILMDAGHLSQTFQLIATELGLGTFVTAAIDGPAIDALIDVDGVGESAIAVLGCGRAPRERSVLDPDPAPYFASGAR
jgi:putative peptide maturation dehydrogenase